MKKIISLCFLCFIAFQLHATQPTIALPNPSIALPLLQTNPFTPGSRPENTAPLQKKSYISDKIVKIQRDLKIQLHKYIKEIKSGSISALLLSILISLAFGIIHAAGPGHRKIVLFSYFSSHPSKIRTLVAASFGSAFIHACSAIILCVALFYTVTRAVSSRIDSVSFVIEQVTYLFIAAFGLAILIKAIWDLCKKDRPANVMTPKEEKVSKMSLALLVITTSIVPCPAASMIMLLTLQQKVAWLGILLTLALSLGMGVTITLAAIPAILPQWGFKKLNSKSNPKMQKVIEFLFESVGAILLILFGLLMSLPVLLAK